MKSSITKVVRIALSVVALVVVVWAPASAQEVTCAAGDTITGTVESIIVDAAPGTCTVTNAVVLGSVEVLSGTLNMTGTIVFGDTSVQPEATINVGTSSVFGKISAEQAAGLSVTTSKVGDGLESKGSGSVAINSSYLGGIKSEQDGSMRASSNLLGDKVEVKEVAGLVNLSGNTAGEVNVEKSGATSLTNNTAFSGIKVVENTSATVTGNVTPKLECSNNNSLTKMENIVVEDKCDS